MNLNDLKNNFVAKIENIGEGFNKDFVSSPAFASALGEAYNLISFLNINEDTTKIDVKQDENSISFETTLFNGRKVSWKLERISDNEIKVTNYNENTKEHKKEASSRNIKRHSSGLVEVVGDNALVTYNSERDTKANIANSMVTKKYDSNGVNITSIYEDYGSREITCIPSVGNVGCNTILYDSARSKNGMNLESRKQIDRKYLDVADVTYESKNVRYKGPMLLDSEHGLREMRTVNNSSESIVIGPITQQQIEALLSGEKNQKIVDGLKAYIKDRDHFYYNSAYDVNFVYEEKGKGINK